MHRLLPVLLLLAAPMFLAAAPKQSPASPREQVDTGGDLLFRKAGVEGAFVLLDVERDMQHVVNPELASQRFHPCSTFKVANALIGLETGVVPGAHFTLPWDGKERPIAAWNREHTLATAMRDSVVPYYQELARRIGRARMGRGVASLGYGNADIGRTVDTFWLLGPLRISAREQVAFLRRLQAGTLPVKPAHAALVRQMLVLEQGFGTTLSGKTGLCFQEGKAVGWLVGELEREGRRYVYASLLLHPDADRLLPLRRTLTERLLRRHGALPPEPSTPEARTPTVPPGAQRALKLERTLTREVKASYLLYLPRAYGEDAGKRWPLVLSLHGGALRGEDVERLRASGLPARAEREPGLPYLLVSPQTGAGTLWTDTELLVALLDEVQARYAVDPARVYVVGHSMGGNGAWYLAYRHPERFAGLIAVSAPANPWWATRLASVPALVLHGDRDEVVPLRESTQMVEALKARGADVTLRVLEGRDHYVLDVLGDPALDTWLLQHARPAGPSGGPG